MSMPVAGLYRLGAFSDRGCSMRRTPSEERTTTLSQSSGREARFLSYAHDCRLYRKVVWGKNSPLVVCSPDVYTFSTTFLTFPKRSRACRLNETPPKLSTLVPATKPSRAGPATRDFCGYVSAASTSMARGI